MSSDSTELYYAHMEADRNEAERAYFDARPLIDREGLPVTAFRAGFERAYAKLWPLAIIRVDELEGAAQETKSDEGYDANGSPVSDVPAGHYSRDDLSPFHCRNCGWHYDKHNHTDEASLCPSQNR